MQLLGTWGRVGDEGGALGYDYRTRGILAGRDLGSSALDWGLAFGYTHARVDFDRAADRGTVQSLQLAAYGERSGAQARLRAVFGVSYDDYDAERHLAFLGRAATASYHGYNVHGTVELGWPDVHATTNVEPFIMATGVYTQRNDFSEQGAADASLAAVDASQSSLGFGAGVRVSHDIETAGGMRLAPRLALDIRREVLDHAPEFAARLVGASGSFPVTGAAPGREVLSLSAALDVRVRMNVNAWIAYQGQARDNLVEQRVVMGVAANW
jgi:outer membrane autotransporter protein